MNLKKINIEALFIILFCILIYNSAFAEHFVIDPTVMTRALPPDLETKVMIIKGIFKINGESPDLADEIGVFVQRNNSEWKLCGHNWPFTSASYRISVWSALCIDDNPYDGIDDVPNVGSVLRLIYWDESTGEEMILTPEKLDFKSNEIKNNNGQFMWWPNTASTEPWELNINITEEININSINPKFGYNDTTTLITINGVHFEESMTAKLGTNSLSSVTYVNESKITAIVPKGLNSDFYDLTIKTQDNRSDTLNDAFEVKENSNCNISNVQEQIPGTWVITASGIDTSTKAYLTNNGHDKYDFKNPPGYYGPIIIGEIPSCDGLPAGDFYVMLENSDGTTCTYEGRSFKCAGSPSISNIIKYPNEWYMIASNIDENTEVFLVNENVINGTEDPYNFANVTIYPNTGTIVAKLPLSLPCGIYWTMLRNPNDATSQFETITLEYPCETNISLKFAKGMNLFSFPVEVEPNYNSHYLLEKFSQDNIYSIQSYDSVENIWSLSEWDEYGQPITKIGDSPLDTPFNLNNSDAYILYCKQDCEVIFEGTYSNYLPDINELKGGLNLVNLSGAEGLSALSYIENSDSPDSLYAIAQFETLTGMWEVAYNYFGDSAGKDFIIGRGKGYIILKHDSI